MNIECYGQTNGCRQFISFMEEYEREREKIVTNIQEISHSLHSFEKIIQAQKAQETNQLEVGLI